MVCFCKCDSLPLLLKQNQSLLLKSEFAFLYPAFYYLYNQPYWSPQQQLILSLLLFQYICIHLLFIPPRTPVPCPIIASFVSAQYTKLNLCKFGLFRFSKYQVVISSRKTSPTLSEWISNLFKCIYLNSWLCVSFITLWVSSFHLLPGSLFLGQMSEHGTLCTSVYIFKLCQHTIDYGRCSSALGLI